MTDVVARQQSPFSQLVRWLDSAWSPVAESGQFGRIRLEDAIRDDRYVVRAELPGLDPEKDVDVSVAEGVLTISGERRHESKDKNRSEFYYGSFTRSIALPANVTEEDITASYKDGILEVSFPFETKEPTARKITVERSE